MTTEQIEKYLKIGEEKGLDATNLAQHLVIDHGLSAADATIVMRARVMREFDKRQYAVVGTTTGRVATRVNVQPKTRKKHEHTPSALVRAATKEFALCVSRAKRGGKFQRAGKSFLRSVEADLENIVRDIGVRNKHSDDDILGEWDFVNHLRIWPKLAEQLNRAIRRRIFERVMSQPSIGKTLK